MTSPKIHKWIAGWSPSHGFARCTGARVVPLKFLRWRWAAVTCKRCLLCRPRRGEK